jgi:hypothetical protein
MRRPRGGSLFLLLTPNELLARLATLVPPPRIHSVRYHGVFAPNCRARKRVVPTPQLAVASLLPPATPASVPGAASAVPTGKPHRTAATYRLPWAELLKKVVAVDVLAYPWA